MDAVMFWCSVLVVAVVAVWQLAAVVLWIWGKVRTKRPPVKAETAIDRALACIVRDDEFRRK